MTALTGSLAEELFEAERDASPLEPLSARHPELTPRDAYAVQRAYAELRLSDGARLVGRKIGATSRAIQELFSIDTPDYGHIFDDMVVGDGGDIELDALIQPMVEPELAFILDRELSGPGVTRADVLAATRTVFPCLEVIDSRISDWRIAFVDTVADNGSSARCAFGEGVPFAGADLAAVEAVMSRNGEVTGRATGEAVLGHPAEAVAWLANALGELGSGLRAGEYVLSGSFMTAIRAERGDRFEASFSGLGVVSCHFV
jgi:2-keto-4-pentenoate hydratase